MKHNASGESSSIKNYCDKFRQIKVICLPPSDTLLLFFTHKNSEIWFSHFEKVYILQSLNQICFAQWFSMWIITRIELRLERKTFAISSNALLIEYQIGGKFLPTLNHLECNNNDEPRWFGRKLFLVLNEICFFFCWKKNFSYQQSK